ncbi:MAG: hypothetical protein AAGF27_01160 [Pseudomonadota bacterium]
MFDSSLPRTSIDRFKSVDSLADRIFDKIPHLEHQEDTPETLIPTENSLPSLPGENVVPLFSPETADAGSILSKTEKLLGGLLNALEGAEGKPADDHSRLSADFANVPDISYQAAQRRQQLPEGVEILQSRPASPSDEAVMTSIRALIEAQEIEFYELKVAKKRERAKEIFTPLELPDFIDTEEIASEKRPTAPLGQRLILKLDEAFRNYYFLAFSLSGWCTLAMMVLIDPAVAELLGQLSMVLLVAAYCMFGAKSARISESVRASEDADDAAALSV